MIIPGLCSITFRKLSVEEVIALSLEAGLGSIEWGGDVHVPHGDIETARLVGEKTRAAGLQIDSYGSYYRAGPLKEGKENPSFEDVLATAKALGAKRIRIWAGWISREKADKELVEPFLADVRRCAELAETEGLSIAYEYHRNTFTNTDVNAQLLAKEIQNPNVEFYWQPHHHYSMEENLAGIEALKDRISNIHVFHWLPLPEEKNDRRLLEEGKDRWLKYLSPFAGRKQDCYAFLEFCRHDEVDNFRRDAKLLKEIIALLT
ncbi:MAG: TIM barrel protein [Spirochaetales bacterium]|nr:TIM barrel protein [Spirochaetales bacterium]